MRRSLVRSLVTLTGIVIGSLLVDRPLPSLALSFIDDRAAIGENDRLDWQQLSSPAPLTFVPNSFEAISQRNLTVNVTIPTINDPTITPPLVFQTLPPPAGIPTNFGLGDFILFTGLNPRVFPSPGNPGPVSITFDTPVSAAGAQIAVDDTFNFTAFIAAYDSDDHLLGQFELAGTSSLNLDNSAVFLGVQDDRANISRLVFSSSIANRAIGINALSLRHPKVPEPSSVLPLLFAVTTIGLWKKSL
jgi:hypothetical protein